MRQVDEEGLQPEDKGVALVHGLPRGEHQFHEGEVAGEPEQPEHAEEGGPAVEGLPGGRQVAGRAHHRRPQGHRGLHEEHDGLVPGGGLRLVPGSPHGGLGVVQRREDGEGPDQEPGVEAGGVLVEEAPEVAAQHRELRRELVRLVDVEEAAEGG